MRERLNNDPKVQLAFLGIAAVALGLILMIQLGGGGAETATTDPNAAATTPAAETGGPDAGATGTDAAATGTGATGGATAATGTDASTATATPPATETVAPSTSAPTTPATGTSAALLPTKGLPSDVLVAYAKSKPVVLLVIDPRSRSAARLEKYALQLEGYEDSSIFIVGTKEVPRYSRITEGVQVAQVPAIVVVTPRKANEGLPTASVTYGVRSKRSFRQAIKDATYQGQSLPAYP